MPAMTTHKISTPKKSAVNAPAKRTIDWISQEIPIANLIVMLTSQANK